MCLFWNKGHGRQIRCRALPHCPLQLPPQIPRPSFWLQRGGVKGRAQLSLHTGPGPRTQVWGTVRVLSVAALTGTGGVYQYRNWAHASCHRTVP